MRVPARIRVAALTGLLCLAAPGPVAAQQVADTARAVHRDSARADTAGGTLPGPRLRPQWQTVKPTFLRGAGAYAPASESTHTFRFTTLELVLIGVVIFLLIVR